MERHTIHSSTDSLPLELAVLEPEGRPWAVVQICHGMSEHKERYEPFMKYLAEQGLAVVIHDHRGHGNSVYRPQDLGYMYGGGATALVEDTYQVSCYCRSRFAGLPLILFGHSMGSLVARAVCRAYDESLDMLIVCGSPSKNPALCLGKLVAHIEKRLFGERHKSRLLELLSFGSYAARFAEEKNRFAWICSRKEVCREYEESPLCGFVFSDDAYLALFGVMSRVYSQKGWSCSRPALPILFVGGADDPCIGNVRKFKQALSYMRAVGYRNVRGKLYPGIRHEILNEADRETVFADICSYIKLQLRSGEQHEK